jgi:hypothetical protein
METKNMNYTPEAWDADFEEFEDAVLEADDLQEWRNPEEYEDNYTDVEADADTLASAGMGTDEDYGYYGGDEM